MRGKPFKKGYIPWNKGMNDFKKRYPQVGFQIGHKPIKGFEKGCFGTKEKNPQWKGGKSFEPYTVDWTKTLKRSIRERDNYICQICNQYGQFVHHIDYDKKNCSPNNLITLCNSCHTKTNKNREEWIKYFDSKNIKEN
jgi:hypothetical protein